MNWYVYIVRTTKGKFYTGISTDVERRFMEHLTGFGGAKALKGDPAEELVYVEEARDRSDASQREYEIKKLKRKQKEQLVQEFSLSLLS
ncbi:MAG: endonuclease [Bdellovibrionales bacterium CG12_big_fil_rev_8_21_14_0_65_38_15]|nr:MAG: endonuclease [Bdellovibrionales bacterium CG22_combo_CG10-13_8_21_14_all_38_13]PIQ53555.1 MAG: endonuclease [Bdellovibrionales bacterium CG12_big_fil_rev_8_21_14_0_65_38_15]PIR28441.1 MAG: endonuclease [Bdellovibrionales bacterium CG11_big_fil_rev_8_21_14_0_20_38_13]